MRKGGALSAATKLLRYARIFYHWRIRGSRRVGYVPEDISIELTNTCNFSCSFCPQSDPSHFEVVRRTTLEPEQANLLLRRIRQGGVRTNVIHWTLDGEPFVNRKIGEICALAIEHGFRTFIFSTNGNFCTPERISKLPAGPGTVSYTLCIDFCADPVFFETHRGTPKSWARVRGNIEELLLSPAFGHVGIKVTDISSFARGAPADRTEQLRALENLWPPSPRLSVASRALHNATGFLPGVLEAKQARHRGYHRCPYPWTSLVVASNGDVVACCRDLRHKTVVGNLFESDLAEIWNGPRYQELRDALAEETPERMAACRECDLPYDASRFTWRHLARTATSRLGIFR